MALPDSVIDTRTKIFGMKTYIDELIPNCGTCFVISGPHGKTKEAGYYASCHKGNKQDLVGPYRSYHEALKFLVLTKGCDSCSSNKAQLKAAYLPVLNEKLKEEIHSLYGIGEIPSVIMSPLQNFVESRNYLDTSFKARFGIRLFRPLTDDLVAGFDIAKPCVDQRDFALKFKL